MQVVLLESFEHFHVVFRADKTIDHGKVFSTCFFFSKNICWHFLTSISVEREIIQLMWKKFNHGNHAMVGFSWMEPHERIWQGKNWKSCNIDNFWALQHAYHSFSFGSACVLHCILAILNINIPGQQKYCNTRWC